MNLLDDPLVIPRTLTVAGAAIAMVTDMKWGKIYNWLTFPLLLAGLVISPIVSGWSGLGFSLLGSLLGIGLYLGLALFGIIGMGDVKLMGAIGALNGPGYVFTVFLYTSLLGIPHALLIQVFNHGFKGIWLLAVSLHSGGFRGKTIFSENQGDHAPTYKFFLGIDIFLACLLAWLYPLNIRW
jgi:Flp pilus assembly protein protease CpaA